MKLCDAVCANTSASGCENLRRDVSHLQQQYCDLCEVTSEATGRVETALGQISEAETALDEIQKWLGNVEQQLRDVPFKATLEEKSQQLAKIKVGL